MKVEHEPAMATAVVAALLALLVGYDVLDERHATLWSALVFALLPLVQGWVTRGLVVPVARLRSEGRRVPERHPTQATVGVAVGVALLVLAFALYVLLRR